MRLSAHAVNSIIPQESSSTEECAALVKIAFSVHATNSNSPNKSSPAEDWSAFPLPLGVNLVSSTRSAHADKANLPNTSHPAEKLGIISLAIRDEPRKDDTLSTCRDF